MGKQSTKPDEKVVPLRSPRVLPAPLFAKRRQPERLEIPRDRYVLPFLIVLGTDVLVLWGSVILAYLTRDLAYHLPVVAGFYGWLGRPFYPTNSSFLTYNTLACAVAVVGLLAFRHYDLFRFREGMERRVRFKNVLWAIGVTYMITMTGLVFVNGYEGFQYARLVVVLSFLYTCALVLASHWVLRWLQRHMVKRGIGFARTVVVAAPGNLKEILDNLRRCYGSLFQVVGFVSSNGTRSKRLHDVPVLGNVREIESILDRRQIDRVIIALPTRSHEDVLEVINACETKKVECRIIPDAFEMIAMKMSVTELNGVPMITLGETPLAGTGSLIKLAMDKVLGLVGVLITGTMFPIVATLIKLDSRGPIFYRQERIGSDNKTFTMYKFRTMYEDAEQSCGPVWAKQDDPRCTRIGRILRRFNIDEFPQFWNVLRGDMSLVGPRPERSYFVEQFKHRVPNYMKRHMVKSGITGWAQVNGLRGDTSIEERIKYDIYYIENWSFWFDVRILFRTLFSRENAH